GGWGRVGGARPASPRGRVWKARLGAFLQGLAILGWGIGQNLRIETRWATPNITDIRRHSAELAALAPDVILAGGASSVGPLLESTRSVPVVFTVANDPVGAGHVDNLARPGGNATGFMSFEFSLSAKSLELLKQMAPRLMRVAVLRDARQNFAMSSFAAVQAVAPSLGVEVIPINMRDAGEIEQSVAIFARSPNGGLIP